jgi:hypothetical protein
MQTIRTTINMLIGNLPLDKREHAEELTKLEIEVSQSFQIPKEQMAKVFVCLAHDWYQMDVEEQGQRLLEKAEAVCPGYFKETIIQHRLQDKNFETVIQNLTVELTWMLMERLNARGENIN